MFGNGIKSIGCVIDVCCFIFGNGIVYYFGIVFVYGW